MSEVASLELCKELYELSGWVAPHDKVWVINTALLEDTGLKKPANYHLIGYGKTSGAITYWPAYDLGFLLRKLPVVLPLPYPKPDSYTLDWYAGLWSVRYGLKSPCQFEARADTPEDAACKLAIELFKQGVLKREAS